MRREPNETVPARRPPPSTEPFVERPRRGAAGFFAGVLLVTLTLIWTFQASIAPDAASAKAPAPCTKRALIRGLRHGETPFPQGHLLQPWGCAGRFAFAAVIIDRKAELTILFRAVGTRWRTADRAKYCPVVPARIWQPACNTN